MKHEPFLNYEEITHLHSAARFVWRDANYHHAMTLPVRSSEAHTLAQFIEANPDVTELTIIYAGATQIYKRTAADQPLCLEHLSFHIPRD